MNKFFLVMRCFYDYVLTLIGLQCWRLVVYPAKINSVKVVIVEKNKFNGRNLYAERWIRPSSKI